MNHFVIYALEHFLLLLYFVLVRLVERQSATVLRHLLVHVRHIRRLILMRIFLRVSQADLRRRRLVFGRLIPGGVMRLHMLLWIPQSDLFWRRMVYDRLLRLFLTRLLIFLFRQARLRLRRQFGSLFRRRIFLMLFVLFLRLGLRPIRLRFLFGQFLGRLLLLFLGRMSHFWILVDLGRFRLILVFSSMLSI